MRCKHLLCDSFQTLLIGSFDTCDWGQAFDETAVLVLNAVCGVLTDLVYKRDRINWRSCLEEDHYIN
jgi:hypothetical protein